MCLFYISLYVYSQQTKWKTRQRCSIVLALIKYGVYFNFYQDNKWQVEAILKL